MAIITDNQAERKQGYINSYNFLDVPSYYTCFYSLGKKTVQVRFLPVFFLYSHLEHRITAMESQLHTVITYKSHQKLEYSHTAALNHCKQYIVVEKIQSALTGVCFVCLFVLTFIKFLHLHFLFIYFFCISEYSSPTA